MKMKPGTYRIGPEAAAICEQYGLPPRELIPWLEANFQHAHKRAMEAEELKEVVRGIVTIEGVNLSKEQKEFFRDLFAGLLKAIQEMKAK
jgi:hypothetical protein